MYFVRKTTMVTFIADGLLRASKAEVTLRGKDDVALHNHWAGMQQKIFASIFALNSEDVDVENGSITTDHITLNVNSSYIPLERHRRPENRSCILCSMEEYFRTDEIEIEIIEIGSDLANESGLLYSATICWVGAGNVNPSVLYTDMKELDKKSILVGRIADIEAKHPDVIVHLFDTGMAANIDNDKLCAKMFVLSAAHGDTGFAKD